MPVYVCAESAVQHYRCALSPAESDRSAQIENLDDAVSLKRDVNLLNLTGLGLPSPSVTEPLHVLVSAGTNRGRAKSVLPVAWNGPLPKDAFREVQKDAYVSSPELTFLQMARVLDVVSLIELGMELCGTYRREALGGLTTYDQPALTTPRKLAKFLEEAGQAYGAKVARQALKYVAPNSASPFETIVYLLLCLPRRLGGYAFPTPKLNASIKLGKRGRQHTLRKSTVPDLYWKDAKLDLECHGKMHELEERRTEDSMRRKALERMHVEVIELTYDEVKDPKLFQATVKRLAKKVGLRLRSKNERHFEAHEQELRNQLLFSGQDEQKLWNEDDLGSEEFESWEGEELPSEFDSWEVYMADGDAPEL
jgi:hypothetical protein